MNLSRGEILGLIGENGAGKSTILKILAEVIPQTTGKWVINGSKLSILEVSTGFSQFLSGRENLRSKLRLMGCSNDIINEYEQEIINFSELESVIDDPVRTYSKGMKARLAFATVTTPKCDVMLLDELLVVGDDYFQGKCLARLASIKDRGTTTILVSHDMRAIERFCDRTIWLKNGLTNKDGISFDTVLEYLGDCANDYDLLLPRQYAEIKSVNVELLGQKIKVSTIIEVIKSNTPLYLQVAVHDGRLGALAILANSGCSGVNIPMEVGSKEIVLSFEKPGGLSKGLVGVVLTRGSNVVSRGVIEDDWGWDNGRHIKFDYGTVAPEQPYLCKNLKLKLISS